MNDACDEDSILLMELRSISERSVALSRFTPSCSTPGIAATTTTGSSSRRRGSSDSISCDIRTSTSASSFELETALASSSLSEEEVEEEEESRVRQDFRHKFDIATGTGSTTNNTYNRNESTMTPRAQESNSNNDAADAENLIVDESNANQFLAKNPENSNFNQYWYSAYTIESILQAILEILGNGKSLEGKSVAFLSTPSLYFALDPAERIHCKLFDYDTVWEHDSGFVFYDYNDPVSFSDSSILQGTFDMVVIDPPFITRDVWENYAITSRYLLKNDPIQSSNGEDGSTRGFVLGTTVKENKGFMMELFGATPTVFLPSCPHLVYQYNIFLNCQDCCDTLKKPNPEIETAMGGGGR